jgi:glycine cleavage system transcriptional repressor
VAQRLHELDCDIVEVSQTILEGAFAALFIAGLPERLTVEALRDALTTHMAWQGLGCFIREHEAGAGAAQQSDPFVVTLDGPDSKGLVSGITGVMSGCGVNIENLKAIKRQNTGNALIMFEISVPHSVNNAEFRTALEHKAAELGVRVSLQHRDIFEAIHRVLPV